MRYKDIFLNCVLPLLCGVLLYRFCTPFSNNVAIQNYLPDGLWAYALVSTMMIVWNRRIHSTWLLIVFSSFVILEALQYGHLMPGTGDVCDILVYFLFGSFALATNNFFKHKYQPSVTN